MNRHILQTFRSTTKQIRCKSFITTPIFYVNGNPHIGHLYTALLADAYHRWQLVKDPQNLSESIFLTGTDEHGTKIQTAATRLGIHPSQFVEENSKNSKTSLKSLASPIQTILELPKKGIRRQFSIYGFNTLKSKGFIEKGVYEGWYSTIDECFYVKDDVETTDSGQMISKESKNLVEWIQEDNYMFDLRRFIKPIKQWLMDGAVKPDNFLPLALKMLESCETLSISRDSQRLKWGIPVPGDASQTIYVWLDALTNYLTAAGYPNLKANTWPPDVQIVGKDIIKFHAVYWPAFLLAADLQLPKTLFVHSHWLVDGRKMSKSYGNVLDPHDLAESLTTEGLRYFLLRHGTPQDDSNITLSKAVDLINAELVNALGNLLSRCTVAKLNPNQEYPQITSEELEHYLQEDGKKLLRNLNTLAENVKKCYDNLYFYRGLELIFEQIRDTNAFLEVHRPWNMHQSPELLSILFVSYEVIRISNILLQPIVPQYAAKALSRLGVAECERTLSHAITLESSNRQLGLDQGNLLSRLQLKAEGTEKPPKKKKGSLKKRMTDNV